MARAGISRPTRVCRSTAQSSSAAPPAARNTASWSELIATPLSGRQTTSLGTGPRPGGRKPAAFVGSPSSRTVLPTVSTNHSANAGNAMSKPIVPTMRAYTGASASRRSRMRSSSRPSNGAKTRIATIADGTMGQPRPPSAVAACSWKNRYAVTNAIAPCAKLKMPELWYVRTSPDAITE